jgi:lysophospholipid acyltransferase (LPLAT)-like uncharacterized protein
VNQPDWQQSRVKQLQVAAIAAIVYPLIALTGLTLRLRVEGVEHLDALSASGQPFILSVWHGRILPLTWFFRRRGIVVITSQNFDGEWIARIIERFGYGTARGSTSRNARAALHQMVREIRAGRSTAFTLDGPRGPALQAKPGAVWLASATGAPLLPAHAEAERYWAMRSWDRTQIPKPFSRVAVVIGAPLSVPRRLSDEAVEDGRRALESVLETLRRRACVLAGREA